MSRSPSCPRLVSYIVALVALGLWAITAATGCGDIAQIIEFDNRLNEAVRIESRYDNEKSFSPGVTVPANSKKEAPVMVESQGIQFRGATESGVTVLDRHYTWKEMEPGDQPFVIVIER